MAMNMSFQRLVAGLKCAPLVVALLVLTSAEAPAEILTFLHAGNGSGTLDGIPFSASDFLITANGDTDDRHQTFSGWHIHHTSASISIEGVADVDFVTPTRHFVSNTARLVGFGNVDAGDLFQGPGDPLFSNWDMLSPIGPITGQQGVLLQWGIFGGVNTTGGILFFDDGTTHATFSAVPCVSGDSLGCGNGVCEPSLGEDCLSCPSDCNGKQNGNPSNRFCCGDGDGLNPVGCNDPRCTSDGFECSNQPVPSFCCGDGFCEGTEDGVNCAVDCAAGCAVPADCDDADPCTIEDCVGGVCVNDPIDCDDGNACTSDSCDPGTGLCAHDPISCDDGDACTADSCDPGSGCVNTFPACGLSDDCCGPACNPGNDPDCPSCGAKNDPCTVDEDCCSLNCRPSGKCSG